MSYFYLLWVLFIEGIANPQFGAQIRSFCSNPDSLQVAENFESKASFTIPSIPYFSWGSESHKVLQAASEQNLPIVAIFLGNEGCPWSQRMELEVLASPYFKEEVESASLIWRISLSRDLDGHQISEDYKIDRFPCILLLDPKGKEFARLDYDASDPALFSKKVGSLIQDFHEVCQAMDEGLQKFDERKLQILYTQASRLSTPCFKQVILNQGLKKEKQTFFHLEKYGVLLQKLNLKHPEVVKLKKELLSRDPDNRFGTLRRMAFLEFEKNASMEKFKTRIEKVIRPLTSYLEQFGQEDSLNRWRVEMRVAEFLFSKQQLFRAIEYVRLAKESAPQEFKPQIIKTLTYMEERQ